MPYVLYKWPPGWGLPSISPASMQVEAYLRFAGSEAELKDCNFAHTSPTGPLPALDHDHHLVCSQDPDEFQSARKIVAFLEAQPRAHDLDAHLSKDEQSQMAAFVALVESKLEPAIAYTTWCEGLSYWRHTRPTYAQGLPFPLNFILPWQQRRAAFRRIGAASAEEVYRDAAAALGALALHLGARGSPGGFFFGERPCTLDAVLLGTLAFLHSAPVAAPELRVQMERHPGLGAYVAHCAQALVAAPLPPAPPVLCDEWAARAEASAAAANHSGFASAAHKPVLTAEEKQYRRNSQLWLAGAGAAIVLYSLLSGQIVVETELEEDIEEEDGYEE